MRKVISETRFKRGNILGDRILSFFYIKRGCLSVYEFIYPLMVAAFFAWSSVVMKGLGGYTDPVRLNLLRSGIGAVFFLLHLVIANMIDQLWTISAPIILFLVLSVIFNVVLGDTSFFISQEQIGVKIAQPLVNLYPLLTIGMAYLFLDEKVSVSFLVGSVIIIVGVILLSQTKDDHERDLRLRGFLYAFAALLFYAAGVLAVTYATVDIDPIVANSIRMPAATILLGLMTGKTKQRPSQKIDRKFVFLIIFAGFLGTYLSSYYLVLSAQLLGAGMTAVLTSLGPLFALPLATLWLKEDVTPRIVGGTVLTIIGLITVLS